MATKRLIMPPVIDLLSLIYKLKNRGYSYGSVSCKMGIRLLNKEVPPTGILLRDNIAQGVKWYKAGMLFVDFCEKDKADLQKKADNIKDINDSVEIKQFLQSMPNTVIPYGMITVALPADFEVPENGSDWILTGRIYQGATPTNLYLAKSIKVGNDFYLSNCTYEPLATTSKTEEQLAIYVNLVAQGSMNKLLPFLRVDERVIPRAGIDNIVPLGPVSSRGGVVQWEVDNTAYTFRDKQIISDEDIDVAIDISAPESLNGQESDTQWETFGKSVAQGVAVIEKPAENIQTSLTTEVIGNGIKVEHGRTYYNRNEFYVNQSLIDYLSSKLESAEGKVALKVAALDDFGEDGVFEYQEKGKAVFEAYWINTMHKCSTSGQYWTRKVMQTLNGTNVQGYTAKMLIKQLITKAFYWRLLDADTKDGRVSEEEAINDAVNTLMSDSDLIRVLTTKGVEVSSANTLMDKLSASLRYSFDLWCLLLVSLILGIDYNFGRVYFNAENNDELREGIDNILAWIIRNPYDLVFLLDGIGIKDLDKLAMSVGLFGNEGLEGSRCVAYLHGFMLSSDKCIDGKTYITLSDLRNHFKYGYTITSFENKKRPRQDIAIAGINYVNAVVFAEMNTNNFILKYTSKTEDTQRVIFERDINTDAAIQNYINSGFGVRLEVVGLPEGLSDYTLLNKEYEIYQKCFALYNADTSDYSFEPDAVERAIETFEANKAKELGIAEFKLEAKQREAVTMVNNNIMALYGGAGTGKTTTSEALLYVLQTLGEIDDSEILFIAPTGKAAVRLREVVKRPTSTIHRALKLGGVSGKPPKGVFEQYKAIIIDENSMITVDLMHTLINSIELGTKVYFLGDIAQLLPIGFGKPFANMLRYLPCVTLEVSKRAKDGSKITECANAWLSIEENEPLKNGKDLKLIGADMNCVADKVIEICKHYLNKSYALPVGIPEIELQGYTQDDIQVISPVKANEKYGTETLNIKLRDVFNPCNKGQNRLFWKGYKDLVHELRVGDRVLHTENRAKEIRYLKGGDDEYLAVDDDNFKGVMNGDIGKIVEISAVDEIKLYDTEGELVNPRGFRKNKVVVMVEYSDINLSNNQVTPYYIQYLLTPDETEDSFGGNFFVLASTVAQTSLELAYALTVHKMQGSQAKLPIFICYAMGSNNSFMSNNLVYTGMTRSQKGLYMLGSVTSSTEMRKIQTCMVLDKRLSVFDVY